MLSITTTQLSVLLTVAENNQRKSSFGPNENDEYAQNTSFAPSIRSQNCPEYLPYRMSCAEEAIDRKLTLTIVIVLLKLPVQRLNFRVKHDCSIVLSCVHNSHYG